MFTELYRGHGTPRTLDVMRWLHANPTIAALNCEVETKTLTQVNWKQRGVVWACTECGTRPMRTGVVGFKHSLVVECERCGKPQLFKPIEQIVKEYKESDNE